MSEKLLLIDGHSILNRAYYGVPDLTNSEGLHTNAVYGFLNILFKILDTEKPEHLTVAFDVHAPTFRHEMFPDYKGNRKGMDPELREQVPVIQELLKAMNINVEMLPGYEADDIIGTLSKQAEQKGELVSIVSGDRDLLQLTSKTTKLIIPKTKRSGTEIEEYFEDDVIEKYHVTPTEFIDVKALQGDSSDNFPGVPGIGEKGAQTLISEFHSIENAYEHIEEIKQKRTREALRENYELGQLCKKLAAINRESPITYDADKCRISDFYTEEAYDIIKKLEFKKLLDRFSGNVKRANPLEGRMRTISNVLEAMLLSGDGIISLSVVGEADDIWGLAYADTADEMIYLERNEFLEIDDLRDTAARLCKQAERVVSYDLKALLHFAFDGDETLYYEDRYDDISVAAYLINPLKGSYPYDEIASEALGIMLPAKEDLITKKTPADELSARRMEYACAICYAAYACRDNLIKELENKGMKSLYYQVEMPLIFTLYGMEKEGILVKRDELAAYSERLSERITVLESEIIAEAGEEFNIMSPKQLGVILFEKLMLPGGKKTKTGYSTAADVLEKLAPDYPIVNKILEYRQLTKLRSTYAESLPGYIMADGRIHTVFNQTVTATGRLSSSDPNLQNIPIRMELGRQIRQVFVPKEGYVFTDADYSQIELRVLAHLSGDPKLIEAYRSAQDIHRLTASQVFNVPLEEVTPLQRRNAKAVNFGIIYGMSAFGLSEDLGISRKEASQYMEQYFETYPAIKDYLDGLVEGAKADGYVRTMFGRIRPLPEITSSNFMQRQFGERVAMNAPIQGTAADIIKIAMNNVYKRLHESGMKSRLLLQVHDELLIETAADETEEVTRILIEEMEGAADLAVKLEIDVNTGANWQEAH